MALLTTNLKGRNVTITRLMKPETQSGLEAIRTDKQNAEKSIKDINSNKKISDKDLKKTRKEALKILNRNDLVTQLNAYFNATGCPSGDTGIKCSALRNNALFAKLQGLSSNEEVLNAFVDDAQTTFQEITPQPAGTPTVAFQNNPDYKTELIDIFFDRTTVITDSGTVVFFANDSELADFRQLVKNLKDIGVEETAINAQSQQALSDKTIAEQKENAVTKTVNGSNRFAPVLLTGVQKLLIKNSSTVGQEPGITTPFLQGWYNNPIEIDIMGKSYLGAFEKLLPLFPEVGDTTVADMSHLFLDNDQLIKNNASLEIEIDIENEGVYQGLISEFSYDESISEPFLLNYSIKFIGFKTSEKSKSNGEQRSAFDFSIALDKNPSNKGLNFLLTSLTPKP